MARARGEGFFAIFDTASYQPRGILLGQGTGYSCVAACCRMLLLDYVSGAEDDHLASESFLRQRLRTTHKGTSVAQVPDVLQERGLPISYGYRRDLTTDDLRRLVEQFPAIALVRVAGTSLAHALIVERVSEASVSIRDPLPESRGSAYEAPLQMFVAAWIDEKTGYGSAVVVVE